MEVQTRAWWQVTGGISNGDADFLAALIAMEQPRQVVEIGVAAGTSSAAILHALDQLPYAGARVLQSVDLAKVCYFNATKPVGAAVRELYPEHQAIWLLDTETTARKVARGLMRLVAGKFDLAFIDADHRHPWPLLDLLHLAPAMKPEAWIALHDVALARLYPQFQSHGAEWLFRAWPWHTSLEWSSTGEAENIGAIQLPADLRDLIPLAQDLLRLHPWEAQVKAGEVELAPVFDALTLTLYARLQR